MAATTPGQPHGADACDGAAGQSIAIEMNRADAFFERDATGWQLINVQTGNVDMHDLLADNRNRSVVFDRQLKRPIDSRYRSDADRIPPQIHF
jgi:hypothetical protein